MNRACPSSCIVVGVGKTAQCAVAEICDRRPWDPVSIGEFSEVGRLLTARAPASAVVAVDLTNVSARSMIELSYTVSQFLPHLSLGFLYGRGEKELTHSARQLLKPPNFDQRVDRQIAFAFREFSHYIRGAHVQEARQFATTARELADLIKSPADVLYLIGHSGGHDAGVEGVVLCRQPALSYLPSSEKAYPCYWGAPCRFSAGEFVARSVDEIRARIVVSLTCWGVSLADFPFSVELSVGSGMLQHAGIRTLLTTIRSATITPQDYLGFYYFINIGLTMGEVVNRINQLRVVRGEQAEFICFGDPHASVDCRIQTVTPEFGSGGTLTCLLPPGHNFDIAYSLPASIESAHSILIVDDDSPLSAALVTSSLLFMTAREVNAACELKFDIVPSDCFSKLAGTVQQIRTDLEYFDRFIRGLGRKLGQLSPDSLVKLRYAVLALEELIDSWAVQGFKAGAIVSARAHKRCVLKLTDCLGLLVEALVGVCSELGHVGDKYLMAAASPYYQRIGVSTIPSPCEYCGGPVAVERYEPLWYRGERHMGICDICGPIFETEPSLTPWLRSDGRWISGATNRIVIDLYNPYSVEVAALAALGVGYELSPKVVCISKKVLLPPYSRHSLAMDVDLPSSLIRGTYYAGVTLALGAKVGHFKRSIQISSPASTIELLSGSSPC